MIENITFMETASIAEDNTQQNNLNEYGTLIICDDDDSNVTDKRLKKSEYDRRRRANFTEEQRTEYNRKRRGKVTDEQRTKRSEYHRKWRANLIEEKRIKRAQSRREQRANMTEEQRLREYETKRKWRSNLTDEQRLKRAEQDRSKYANLTEEQRKQYFESKRAKLTEEQRIKRLLSARQKYANEKEEQRLQRAERHRRLNASLTEEERKKRSEQRKKKSCKNPLQNIIKQMINSNINFETITGLEKDICKKVLKMFSFRYSKKYIMLECNCTIESINYQIDVNYLIKLLSNWEGWTIYDNIRYLSSEQGYDDLFNYLSNNFLGYKLYRDKYLLDELKNFHNTESYINVTCSMKRLQMLFYRNPQNHVNYYREDESFMTDTSYLLKGPFPHYIINWAYVSTEITLPNFSMTHKNVHVDEFELINTENNFKTNKIKEQNTSIYSKTTNDDIKSKILLKDSITKYLCKIKTAVINSDDMDISVERKNEIKMVLREFENDIALCSDVVELNKTYFIGLAPYPYTRYLGYANDKTNNFILVRIKSPVVNVRLQQNRYPKISFVLEHFSETEEDDIHSVFNQIFLHMINTCISYNCLLCNEYLGSSSPSQTISDHFIKYHGLEPDWKCVKCIETFDNEYLLKHRWWHDCK